MSLSFFLSFDSFAASLALGLLLMSPWRSTRTCLLFGLCDAVATLAGLSLHSFHSPAQGAAYPWIIPTAMCAWIFFVGFLVRQIMVRKPTSALVVTLVPFILSLDNFCAARFYPEPFSQVNAAIVAAVMSTTFALIGFAVAGLFRDRVPKSLALGLGAILLCLAPLLF